MYNLTWDELKTKTHLSENLSASERSYLVSRINGVRNRYGKYKTKPLLKVSVDFIIRKGVKLFNEESASKIKEFKKKYLESKSEGTSQGQLERNFKAYVYDNRYKQIEEALNNVKSLEILLKYSSVLHQVNLVDKFYPTIRTRRLALVRSYKGG